MNSNKPPIGVMPRHIAEEMRTRDLDRAIILYIEAGCHVPVEWITERNELIAKRAVK